MCRVQFTASWDQRRYFPSSTEQSHVAQPARCSQREPPQCTSPATAAQLGTGHCSGPLQLFHLFLFEFSYFYLLRVVTILNKKDGVVLFAAYLYFGGQGWLYLFFSPSPTKRCNLLNAKQHQSKKKLEKLSTQLNTNKSNNLMCWKCGLECCFIEVGFSMLDLGKKLQFSILYCNTAKKNPYQNTYNEEFFI